VSRDTRRDERMVCVSYASVVGSLMYAMVYTQPYISHVVGVFSRYMPTPGKEHWTTVKRVFRYLCGTIDFAIYYLRICRSLLMCIG